MGELKNKRIVQSRNWLDPNQQPIPNYDYEFVYPRSVYEAIQRTMEDNSPNLADELTSIYRLIADKQDIIQPGTPGQLMTWSGIQGQIGAMETTRAINTDPSLRSHQKIPTERAVGDALDTRAPLTALNAHTNDGSIHLTDVERSRWNSMAPLTSLQSHISNSVMHITNEERSRWNDKANAGDLDNHLYNTNNPHNVSAHQVGTYTRKEVDDMFASLRESFFNYLNISWDDRSNTAELVQYHPANWNPNYVLAYADPLPDVPDATQTYFALKPSTDYSTNESEDCIIYVKRPGLTWQEVGSTAMNAGDMIIKFPDTVMYVWMQGRFIRLFSDSSGDPDDEINGNIWRPIIDEDGMLKWELSKDTTVPTPTKVKGEDGYTPIKGIDYEDGKDGEGVPIGGTQSDILIKLSDENYDTSWKSLIDILKDLALSGTTLPDNIVKWDSIDGRPNSYDGLGPNEDGYITQKGVTREFENVNNQITEILTKVDGPTGIEATRTDLYDHINDYNNPHRVTPAIIGAVSTSTFTDHIQNFDNPHNVTKEQVGLGNVDNTSDLDKPISNSTQIALDAIKEKITIIDDGIAASKYIVNVTWDSPTNNLEFEFKDGDKLGVTIPITETFNNISFDDETKELVIILPDGTENRINISALIQTYYGSVGANIQVVIEDDNVIKASIVPGSIGEYEIAPSVHLRTNPTTNTQVVGDRSTRIATTEFVAGQVINNLISYETDRALSANMGRVLNQNKADIEDVIQIINDLEGIQVIDTLDSTNPLAALSANMGRYLDLVKAPRVHTSPSGATFGRATISLFGHTRASEVDPLMDGTVFRGTDDGRYARADHRHPTDITRAPIHFPDIEHNQYSFTGEPNTTLPPDDSNDDRIPTTEWVRRNALGVHEGICPTAGNADLKIVTLKSDFMDPVVFLRQRGSTVTVIFDNTDVSTGVTQLNVQGSGAASVMFGGIAIVPNMISANHAHIFTYDGTCWQLLNPAGIHTLDDADNSNRFVSSEWVRRNVVGVAKGISATESENPHKTATLFSTYMDPVVFIRQIGTTVAITFNNEDISGSTPTTLKVQESSAAQVLFAGIPVRNGMIGRKHTHLFTFDGTYWHLLNPVPGTGIGGEYGETFGPGGKNPPYDGTINDGSVVNLLSGYSGYTTDSYGASADSDGRVNKVIFGITFPPRKNDINMTFSNNDGDFAARTGDDSLIILENPSVIHKTKQSAVVLFNMKETYPSNSPCKLIYRKNTAWFNVKEIGTNIAPHMSSEEPFVPNTLTGFYGYTTEGYGSNIDSDGKVYRAMFTVLYPNQENDIDVTFSSGADHWSSHMPDGEIINLRNPQVVFTSRESATVVFTMDTGYPSNTPCTLCYRSAGAWYNISEERDPLPFVANTITGFYGYTTEGYGRSVDGNGLVSTAVFSMTFSQRTNSVNFTISTGGDDWSAKLPNDTYIGLKNPQIMSVTKNSATVRFTMDASYPSNTPCMLCYKSKSAWFNVEEISGKPPFVPVTSIDKVPTTMKPGISIDLSAIIIVNPFNATNQSVIWSIANANGTEASVKNSVLSVKNGGSFTLRATVKNGATETTDFVKDYTVISETYPIVITSQPPTSLSVVFGSAVGSLTVNASIAYGSLSYQWYENTTASNTGGSPISGATNRVFTIPSNITAKTHYYFCEVRGTNGATPVRSYVSTVSVIVKSTGISITPKPTKIGQYETVQLNGNIVPANTTNKTIEWSVNNTGLATINLLGALTAKAPGNIIVTARAADSGVTDSFSTSITEFIPVSSVSLQSASVYARTTTRLVLDVLPSNATNKTPTWSVIDGGGLSIAINGSDITVNDAVTENKFISLRATIKNGTNLDMDYVHDFLITVAASHVPISKIVLDKNYTRAKEELGLKTTILPFNATNQEILWSVVNDGGTGTTITGSIFLGRNMGTSKIRATVKNGATETTDFVKDFDIYVNEGLIPVADITDLPESIFAGFETPSMEPVITPREATNQGVEYRIVDAGSTGATFSTENETITAPRTGKLVLETSVYEGLGYGQPFVKNHNINVVAFYPVTNIIDTPISMRIGQQLQLVGTVLPANATYKTIEWTIKNDGLTGAVIDNNNKLTARQTGDVIIEAAVINGVEPYDREPDDVGYDPNKTTDFLKDIKVQVLGAFVPVSSITTNIPGTMNVGDSVTISTTIAPANATNQIVTLRVLSGSGSISGNVLSATGAGTLTVRATVKNGATETTDFVKDIAIAVVDNSSGGGK